MKNINAYGAESSTEPIKVPANTRHWHGATEYNSLTQMYILPKTENGFVTWMEPVTDEQYKSNN